MAGIARGVLRNWNLDPSSVADSDSNSNSNNAPFGYFGEALREQSARWSTDMPRPINKHAKIADPAARHRAWTRWYHRRGLHPFPVDSQWCPTAEHEALLDKGVPEEDIPRLGKRPLVKWKPFQTTAPTPEQLFDWWWGQFPGANIATATGRGTGIVVLDLDSAEALALWAEHGPHDGPQVERDDHRHIYLQHPGDEAVPNRAAVGGIPGLDVRGDGGMIILPPSMHRTGQSYKWLMGQSTVLPAYPGWLRELNPPRSQAGSAGRRAGRRRPGKLRTGAVGGGGAVPKALAGLSEGSRNDGLFRALFRAYAIGIRGNALRTTAQLLGGRCSPPLPVSEVDQILASVLTYDVPKLEAHDA